jgi:hypothetical protein
MARISSVSNARGAGHLALILAGSLAVAVLLTSGFAGSAQAGASQAGMAAAQSAVRDARDQVQRRQWAQHRAYQR